MKKTKKDYSYRVQFYVEMYALYISTKEDTIDSVTHPVLRELILIECKEKYGIDGYGNPLQEEKQD